MADDAYAHVVVGSKLKFKGKKKKEARSTEVIKLKAKPAAADTHEDEPFLTDAERKYKKRRLEKEKVEITEAVKKTHREKVEELNQKLATLTEHNDIPRISAAGNG